MTLQTRKNGDGGQALQKISLYILLLPKNNLDIFQQIFSEKLNKKIH